MTFRDYIFSLDSNEISTKNLQEYLLLNEDLRQYCPGHRDILSYLRVKSQYELMRILEDVYLRF